MIKPTAPPTTNTTHAKSTSIPYMMSPSVVYLNCIKIAKWVPLVKSYKVGPEPSFPSPQGLPSPAGRFSCMCEDSVRGSHPGVSEGTLGFCHPGLWKYPPWRTFCLPWLHDGPRDEWLDDHGA